MAYPNYYQGGYYPQYQNGAVPDMLNQYKGQYQQMPMQQPMMQQPVQQMPIQSNGGLIWVDNEEQAKNYLVAPNNVVPMFDKNSSQMYIKSADGAGMPTFKKYKLTDFEEADNTPKTPDNHECKCGSKFVSKEDFKALQSEFEALREELEELKAKPKAKTAKKAVEEVENDG
jgi:hypothetical protein